MNAVNKEPSATVFRFVMRDEARRQTLAPNVLKIIEENLSHVDAHLNHLEKQERFLISEFLKSRPCVWCDSDVSWFEAISPADAECFSLAKSGPEAHECPHCKKRIVYALPFIGGWRWIKHKEDLNPSRVERE